MIKLSINLQKNAAALDSKVRKYKQNAKNSKFRVLLSSAPLTDLIDVFAEPKEQVPSSIAVGSATHALVFSSKHLSKGNEE